LTHEHMPRQLKHPIEPDGPRWDAAIDFDRALHRWEKSIAYGLTTHPLDDPEPRFLEFIQKPAEAVFEPKLDMRVDVSNEVETTLFADINFEDYYCTWQLLLAAEVADAGVHMRLNLGDKDMWRAAHESLDDGRIPEGAGYSVNFLPVHAARDFTKHERALDAVIWFSEERWRALCEIIKGQGGGRFRLNAAQSGQYEQATQAIVAKSAQRFGIGLDDLIAMIRVMAKRWSDWKREGRPLIADAYEAVLEEAVILARRVGKLSFGELRDRVGSVGGWFKPILEVIWPDWAEQEKERVLLTLKANVTLRTSGASSVTEADIDAFVTFLAGNGLEAFFWRLKSFENHALRGNEFAIEGMKSDIQGMSVTVEHVAVTLGANGTQLYEKFKQLWRNADVLRILKRGDVSPLARQKSLAQDWPALKAKIDSLRAAPGGEIAADLVMAHRIRGGVHEALPEEDHFELEALFTGLMRAALLTFVEARREIGPSPADHILPTAQDQ
jgi:hypothetical protein